MKRKITDKERKIDEYLNLFRLKASIFILQYLHQHGDTRYTELQNLTSTYTLTMRLRTLRKLGLVEHHIDKEQRRREWYTITEKGKKMVTILNDILDVFEK